MTVPVAPTARPGRWAMSGLALLGVGMGLGAYVTKTGAGSTGELGLDQLIAGDRETPLIALSRAIDVGLGPMVAPVLLLIVCAAVAIRNRWGAVVLGAATTAGWVSVELGKILLARHRPPIDEVHALIYETGMDSYPSGHTAFAAALLAGTVLALRVAGRSTRWAWLLGVPAVLAVAGSRLYLGAHYLGDVIGSILYVSGTVLVLAAITSAVLCRRQLAGVRAGQDR